MRRKELEVKEVNELIDIIKKCDVCRIAMVDNNLPYIVPMNFGYEMIDDQLTLYFHCAAEGRKINILKNNPNICFEMDCEHKLIEKENACSYTMHFESIVGNGVVEFISDFEQKKYALSKLMRQYAGEKSFEFNENAVNHVTIFKVVTKDFTGKRKS